MLAYFSQKILWQRLAHFIARYRPQLLGVVGSTGKTLTREALAVAFGDDLRLRFPTHSVHRPQDVALAILGIDHFNPTTSWFTLLARSFVHELAHEEPETILVEVGAARPGDVDFVSQQLAFKVMIVTNVGTTHTELFFSKDMVAHELTSAVVTLPKDSIAVLNADDPLVAAMATKTKAQVVTFGHDPSAHIRIVRIDRLPSSGLAVTLVIDKRSYELPLPHVIARHHVSKIAAALAVVHALGLDVNRAVKRLQTFTPPPGRLRKLAGKHGSIILDDTYSASPEVTAAALQTLKAFNSRRKIAILGDMLGLGLRAQKSHEEIGRAAAAVAQIVIVVGQEMRHAGREALKAGADVHQFDAADEVGKWFSDFIQAGDVVLVAGSRAMHMEEVVERLLADPQKDSDKLVQE